MINQCVTNVFPTACDPPDPEIETPARVAAVAGAIGNQMIRADRVQAYPKNWFPAIIIYRVDASLSVVAFAILDRVLP